MQVLCLNLENDEDAKIGHKNVDTSVFGYKTHIAMTPERIITAATITSGEKPDENELPELVRKSRKAGMKVENVIADRAYSGKGNRDFVYNKDADMMQCPVGELSVRKAVTGEKSKTLKVTLKCEEHKQQ